jgi:hypothetical protein
MLVYRILLILTIISVTQGPIPWQIFPLLMVIIYIFEKHAERLNTSIK